MSLWWPAALLLLTAMAFTAHELSHHVFGALVCGGFGSASFTRYEVRGGCSSWAVLATGLVGPLVSLVLAYGGAWLAWCRRSTFGWLLIFASYFHLRFMPPLLGGGNDELYVVRQTYWLGGSSHAVAAGLLLIALPPVVVGFRVLAGRWRVPMFVLAWLLPLVVLAASDAFDALLTGKDALWPNLGHRTLMNVPVIVFLVNLLLGLVFALGWRPLKNQNGVGDISRRPS